MNTLNKSHILYKLIVILLAAHIWSCGDGKKKSQNAEVAQTEQDVFNSKEDSLLQMIKDRNQAVHLMKDTWMRDPFITLAPDGNYYLSATRQNESFPDSTASIEFWRSPDLVNWEELGVQWRAENSEFGRAILKKGGNRNQPGMIWAPEIHPINDKWVIVNTSNAGMANLMITEGPELSGPFIEPFGADLGGHHDPSIFMDGDQPYLIAKVMEIIPLKKDFSGFAGEPVNVSPADRKMGHEGSFIVKIEDKYIWFGTAWSTDEMRHGTYNLYYSVSDSIMGPYGERKFAGRFLGHGTPFQDKNGNWWCTAFYNANKPAVDPTEAHTVDMSDTAYTINKQGLTLVPMQIEVEGQEVTVKPLDPAYQKPGEEEAQDFEQ